jgi:hypothetical protein
MSNIEAEIVDERGVAALPVDIRVASMPGAL